MIIGENEKMEEVLLKALNMLRHSNKKYFNFEDELEFHGGCSFAMRNKKESIEENVYHLEYLSTMNAQYIKDKNVNEITERYKLYWLENGIKNVFYVNRKIEFNEFEQIIYDFEAEEGWM